MVSQSKAASHSYDAKMSTNTISSDFVQVGVNTIISNLHGMIGIARAQKRELRNNFSIVKQD